MGQAKGKDSSMALAILSQDRGSADPCAETADQLALTAELVDAEQITPFEAETQAVALIDELTAYAAVWDADAASAGNPDARPMPALPIGTLATLPVQLALLE
jgi:hypothetical protein